MKLMKFAGLPILAVSRLQLRRLPKIAARQRAEAWNQGGGEQDEALDLTPDLENGRDVYEVCSACHQLNGWGLTDGTFPQIAGQHSDVLIKQLADIRALNRDNPTMYPFALPQEIGGPQAIADVAAYIAKLPMNPENGVGPGDDLDKGEQLYADNCVRCHGDNGAGDNDKFYPAHPRPALLLPDAPVPVDQGRQAPQCQSRHGQADPELHR